METSIEVYYKDIDNISDVIDNGDILGNEFLESQLRVRKGWAYGYELMVRGESNRFDGFIGYTWSRTRRKIDGINKGRPYYSPNDRRHDFSFSGGYLITGQLGVSLSFTYASGRAFTFPVGKILYQGDTAPIFSDRNSGNLPDYHRFDISFNYTTGRSNSSRRFTSTWNFSLFNVYVRINPISVSFQRDRELGGIMITGNTYNLIVIDDGKTYTASSTLKPVPDIDSVTTIINFLSQLGIIKEVLVDIYIHFENLPHQGNYYLVNIYINGNIQTFTPNQKTVISDENLENHVSLYIKTVRRNELKNGDKITMEMRNISRE